ncbi:MAG: response regulator [Myxococcaceae bacterium]|nr:response regulator [Myxococcaceae bacterium]MCI0672371.1 response regulator [Myxococcaceae bacterium]
MERKARLLVVDDKENMLKLLARILGDAYDVETAQDGSSALSLLQTRAFDVVLTDIRMPGADGFEVLRTVKRQSADTEVILMTAYASVPKAVEAMREGAYDYLQKPFDPDEVSLVVARALEHKRLREQALEQSAREVSRTPAGPLPPDMLVKMPFRDAVELAREHASRDYLAALLREFDGNVTHAATHAGMERESLHRLLRRHGLRSEDFKP